MQYYHKMNCNRCCGIQAYDSGPCSHCPESNTELITAIAKDIINDLGVGHAESVYRNAMKIGLKDVGIAFESGRDLHIMYHGRYVGTLTADIVISNDLVLNFTTGPIESAEKQCRLIMRELNIAHGVAISFGSPLVIHSVP